MEGTVTISVKEFNALQDADFLISNESEVRSIFYSRKEGYGYLRFYYKGESDLVKNIIQINSEMSKNIDELNEEKRILNNTIFKLENKSEQSPVIKKNWLQILLNL